MSETNSKIVVMTRHFSEIVISKVQKGRIVDEVDSGFTPGTDDFQMDNYGSYITKGHCGGQCLAELYYFCNKNRIGWEKPLYGRTDNNGPGENAGPLGDDSRAVRLCSAVQVKYAASETSPALANTTPTSGQTTS